MKTAAGLARTARAERRIVSAFRAQGALSLAALGLPKLGLLDGPTLNKLVADGILKKAGPDRWFLDEQTWASRRRLHGPTLLRIAMALGVALVAVALYLASR
jgi:hypothetical protein